MMGLVAKIAGSVAGLVGVALAGGLILPSRFAVERSVVADVPVEAVFEQVVDLKRLALWKTWHQIDPSLQVAFGDVTVGEGAMASFNGSAIGAGIIQIDNVEMNRRVAYVGEVAGVPIHGAFRMRPGDSGTEVSWSLMSADPTWILGPYRALLMPRAVGPLLDEGLGALVTAASRPAEGTARRTESP